MWENIEILNLRQQREKQHLVLQPDYHTLSFFTEGLLAIEVRKPQILISLFI